MSLKKLIFKRRIKEESCGELKDKTVAVNRVAKVVKGGRRFSFNALVVCGDGQGHVGFGLGKANEVPDAIRKASEQARKNIVKVPMSGTTVPHDCIGHAGPSQVIIRPGAPGTGVIAGSAVRAVVEAAGIKDIRTKCIGSSNPNNVLHAALNGLLQLRDPEEVARNRNRKVIEWGYSPY